MGGWKVVDGKKNPHVKSEAVGTIWKKELESEFISGAVELSYVNEIWNHFADGTDNKWIRLTEGELCVISFI